MANAALCGSKSEYQRDSKRLKMIQKYNGERA
jgi:hypothetical protein